MATGPIQANPRVVGDDWTFHATTDADVADHNGLVVQLRDKLTGVVLADSQGDEPTIITDGITDEGDNLEVAASEFGPEGGELWLVIRRAVTREIAPAKQLVLQVSVDSVQLGGRRTIGTFEFATLPQVAVEVAS